MTMEEFTKLPMEQQTWELFQRLTFEDRLKLLFFRHHIHYTEAACTTCVKGKIYLAGRSYHCAICNGTGKMTCP